MGTNPSPHANTVAAPEVFPLMSVGVSSAEVSGSLADLTWWVLIAFQANSITVTSSATHCTRLVKNRNMFYYTVRYS